MRTRSFNPCGCWFGPAGFALLLASLLAPTNPEARADLASASPPSPPPGPPPGYTVTDLGVLPGHTFSYAEGLNELGWAVGGSGQGDQDEGQACLFVGGSVVPIPIPSCTECVAVTLNNFGLVVARCTAGAQEGHYFLVSNGVARGIAELTGQHDFAPHYLTDEGWLLGSIRESAALFRDGQLRLLTGPPGWGILSNVIWNGLAYCHGVGIQLGNLPGLTFSQVYAVNNQCLIVGAAYGDLERRALVQWNGQLQDLNTLIPTNSGWSLEEARDINDRGQIVGYGRRQGQPRAFLLTPLWPSNAPPVTPGALDESFPCDSVVDDVRVILRQPDGKLLVGGEFHTAGPVLRRNLARLLPDGSVDPSFAPDLSALGVVTALALQSDGKVLAGFPEAGVIRFLTNGQWDASFSPDLTFDPRVFGFWVTALALQPHGQVLVAGRAPYSGDDDDYWLSPQLFRLWPDGRRDSSFTPYHGPVEAMALLPYGALLVAGDVLARLHPDGTVDPAFAATADSVYTLAVQPDGKILIGGEFTTVNGQPRSCLARLLPNGALDSNFDPATGAAGGDPEVDAIALQADGRILIGGSFTNLGGQPRECLARLNPDGSVEESFVPSAGLLDDEWSYVRALLVQDGNKALVGGQALGSYDGFNVGGLFRIDLGEQAVLTVRREFSNFDVQLVTTPLVEVASYAVEDRPPTGWLAADISDGGVFDSASGKVKWGPFFESEPRTLHYRVLAPAGFLGVGRFSGTGSADGWNTPIVGEDRLVISGPHPADLAAPTWNLAIEEVTAYGAAWRRGQTWSAPPNPIPIDYVTRAGSLWRQGECYRWDSNGVTAPLWWMPCLAATGQAPAHPSLAASALPNAATRQQPVWFVPGEPLPITIQVTPASTTSAYAVADQLPVGWTAESVGAGGQANPASGQVKWGPFFDFAPRTLSYQVTPPATATGPVTFTGVASFDGASVPISGPAALQPSGRVWDLRTLRPGQFRLDWVGVPRARWSLEASSDLRSWTTLPTVLQGAEGIEFTDPAAERAAQRFYRVRLEP